MLVFLRFRILSLSNLRYAPDYFMRPRIILFLLLCLSVTCVAQKKKFKYKWPYLGEHIPPYLGVTAGYEGFRSSVVTAGVAFNIGHLTIHPRIGALLGAVTSYKQDLKHPGLYSLESDLGIFGGFCFGVGLNYNKVTNNEIYGIKPLIGLAFYNFNMYYGYNFYADKMDMFKELSHHKFTFRYIIPVLKLVKNPKKGLSLRR